MRLAYRSVMGLGAMTAALALAGSAAFAYVQVPPGAAPAPPVSPTKVVVSLAPQPVKKQVVRKGKPQTFTSSISTSNPTEPIKVSVHILKNAFVQKGKIVFAVSNAQNVASIQKAVGSSETVLTSFEMVARARSIKPMIVTLSAPQINGAEVAVFALHANGFGSGFHYIYVHSKRKGNTITFPVNRNEAYIIIVKG